MHLNRTLTVTRISIVLLLGAMGAWIIMVLQMRTMESMPGTMGMSPATFVGMWALMIAAMMLPSVTPVTSRYTRMIDTHKGWGLVSFIAGYLGVWLAGGIIAYCLTWLYGRLASGSPTLATMAAVATYAACGFYQFSSLKYRCLAKCRVPFSLLLEYASWQGRFRHLRVGAHHGVFCLGCCWALMLVMISLGLINLGAMFILTIVIAVEKIWVTNITFSRVVGFVCFGLAIAVIWFPQLAPGLILSHEMTM
jgi:predicted metal-binding membrane protein